MTLPFFKRNRFFIVIVCAVLFFIVTMPFRHLFSMLTVTEVRPASALPPVFGLLFGFSGALGAAIGNFAADIVSGYNIYLSILGFFAQFLYGYIPYKLWHTLLVDKKNNAVHLGTVKNTAKFAVIMLINSIIMAGLVGEIMEIFKIASVSEYSTVVILFNNFDFCMLLGIPAIIVWYRFQFGNIEPQKTIKNAKIVVGLLCIAMIFAVSYYLYSLINKSQINPEAAKRVLFAVFVFSYAAVFIPTLKEKKLHQSYQNGMSFTEQTTVNFLFFSIVSLVLISVISYKTHAGHDSIEEIWRNVYENIAFAINILFICLYIFLHYFEQNITVPVEQISDITVRFAKSTHTQKENLALISDYKNILSKNNEMSALKNSLVHMIVEVEEYEKNLAAITAEKERIGVELDIAAKIQISILPQTQTLPKNKTYDLEAFILPAKEMGGDFYDFFYIDDTHFGLVIADVSGKGIPAAMIMMKAKTLIKQHSLMGLPPAKVFERANINLCENNTQSMFVTAFMGIIDLQNGVFTCVNAGHNPPLLKRANGDFEWFKQKNGPILAALETSQYKEHEVTLQKGDILFLYTDGVTEATNEQNELFGEPRFLQTLNQHKQKPLSDLIAQVKNHIDDFVGNAPQFDDITMLLYTHEHVNQITVEAKLENYETVNDFVFGILKDYDYTQNAENHLKTIIEEIFVNIVHYSFSKSVTIQCAVKENIVTITFIDEGTLFNPLQNPEPNITLSAKDRKIGGLGIYMAKKMSDAIFYTTENKKNILTVQKRLTE